MNKQCESNRIKMKRKRDQRQPKLKAKATTTKTTSVKPETTNKIVRMFLRSLVGS